MNARLLVEEKHGVVLVPNAAIQRNSQSTYVYVVKPDQTVTVRNDDGGNERGRRHGDQLRACAGRRGGHDGVDKLQEGSKVAPSFPASRRAAITTIVAAKGSGDS